MPTKEEETQSVDEYSKSMMDFLNYQWELLL